MTGNPVTEEKDGVGVGNVWSPSAYPIVRHMQMKISTHGLVLLRVS